MSYKLSAERRNGGTADGSAAALAIATPERASAVPPFRRSADGLVRHEAPACQRCGFAVVSRPFGCKNPCPNCGTVYPLGDCSD